VSALALRLRSVDRRAWAAAAALAAAAAGLLLWRSVRAPEDGGYVTEAVDRGEIVALISATGTVNPVTTVQVGTYVSGPIQEIDVDFNSPVVKGQRVAKIDPAPFQVKVQRAEANLANAHAAVEKARADLELKRLMAERNRTLRQRNLVAQSDLDTAQSQYEQARAQLALDEAGVQQAQADLDEARINLNYTDIRSPVDGVVVSRNVDVGQTVAASFQTPTLFLIAQDLTKMQVNANVSESDIGGLREGQTAHFSVDAYPERQFEGTVVQVRNAPTTVQNVVTYDVVIAIENPEGLLRPDMTANTTITVARREKVLAIPNQAVRREDGARVAFVQEGERLVRRPIKTGWKDKTYTEVLGGLKEGDRVVVGEIENGKAPAKTTLPPGAK
jgi:HlyD family secretion protein